MSSSENESDSDVSEIVTTKNRGSSTASDVTASESLPEVNTFFYFVTKIYKDKD